MESKKTQKSHKKLNAIIISVIATIAIVVTICLMVAYRSEITKYSINYYEGNIVYYIDAKPDHTAKPSRISLRIAAKPKSPPAPAKPTRI